MTDAPVSRGEAREEREGRPRRRRPAAWIAAGLAVALVALVWVLARTEPATTRVADSPLLGQPVPDVRAQTIDGTAFDLADLRGKWVVVNFFATWCVPCRIEHPELIQWQQRHELAGDATIVGVIFDDSVSAVRQFREEEGGDWPMLIDADGRIALDFGVAGVPESYLVDPDGVIVSKIIGGILDGELESALEGVRGAGR